MTTNQTIDGVRTLAEQACGTSPDSPEYRRFIAAMNPTLLLDLTSPAAQPQGEPVALLSKGFTTLETSDGKYRIITQYKNRDDAWSDYTALCKAEQPAPVEWVSTVAQIRYRRPERNYPDFGIWHEFPLKHYDKNRTWFIDNNGWECETRLLFLPVVKP